MSDFVPGQRWVNDAELQLGLGTVLAVEQRTVTLVFMTTGDTRIYSKQTAPLTRVIFSPGDQVRSHEGWSINVTRIDEQDGLLTYTGTNDAGQQAELPEGQLDSHLQLNRPADRLFTGQMDQDKWFELRYDTLLHASRLTHSELFGLTGGRTQLIPHQLYIAREVANRYAPRVLLADEVGLGKTIEAGMILHQQLLTERAQRVLVVVPENLLHQWLVEMLRRFNLTFSVFDEARCAAITASSGQENPFHSEQLVLCSLEFLVSHPEHHRQAAAGDWDLLVVDEAHHLQWSPAHASPEYRLIEQLALETRGVLLLSATPEQLGKESHFARLRLLDPDRFPDFTAFIEEEQAYEPVARAIEALLGNQVLDTTACDTLRTMLNDVDNRQLIECIQDAETGTRTTAEVRMQLVEQLLDRHGTGRVLFRNTRSAVQGFPDRQLQAWPLPLPDDYASTLAAAQAGNSIDPQLLLCPELLYRNAAEPGQAAWTDIDPRIDWLNTLLGKLRPEKVLVITASAGSAMDIAAWLYRKKGIHTAAFHEGLSIIERDRAAAYFADMDDGTQVLICSEIGSEGRNFQFAHHLVLFDLPLNPDLLEQRIGRLDRIGQTETIQIHVPYLEDTAQAVLLQWYHKGLDAFEHICPAAQPVFVTYEAALLDTFQHPDKLPALLSDSRALNQSLNTALHRGRDRLLEYNSCRPRVADDIKATAEQLDSNTQLPEYLEKVFDCYGIESEPHSKGSSILHPGEEMHGGSFPGLQAEGMTITYDRGIALANEDRHFITWEHPLVSGAMDRVLSSELGNCCMTAIKSSHIKPGTLLLECVYILEAVSSNLLQTARYLPPTTVRVVLDQDHHDVSRTLTHGHINTTREAIPVVTASTVIRTYKLKIRDMLAASEILAKQQITGILDAARQQSEQTLAGEIDRLKALGQVNPNVRAEEIEFMEYQRQALVAALDAAALRLDALRVIVAT